MQPFSHRKAILTGRSLAEAEWATTPSSKRPLVFAGLSDRPGEIHRIPRAFAAWARHGAMERWRELVDADRRRRALGV